ncbi:MAG: ribonucleoside-diphosphate reductase alpha chain, partial [Spirochaetes bacterium]
MKFERRFTTPESGPYHGIEWEERRSEIRNPNGKMVFQMDAVIVPSSWSQIATDIIAQKYFRKAGVSPDKAQAWKSFVPKSNAQGAKDRLEINAEYDARQVFHRLAFTWLLWGKEAGYFDSREDE